MDTSQIIKKLTRQLNISEDVARMYFDTFVAIISEELQKGNEASLAEFGEFYLEIQNVIPCETDANLLNMRKAVRKVVFIPSKKLEDCVNRW